MVREHCKVLISLPRDCIIDSKPVWEAVTVLGYSRYYDKDTPPRRSTDCVLRGIPFLAILMKSRGVKTGF